MGALLGRPADREDGDRPNSSSSSTGNSTSKESSLSQIGASAMGVESAERESRPAIAAGMGPSSPTGNAIRASGNLEVTSQGAGQRSSVVRSMILEKPPSFKVGALHDAMPSLPHHPAFTFSPGLSCHQETTAIIAGISGTTVVVVLMAYSALVLQVRSQLPGQAMTGRTAMSSTRPRLRVSSLDETKSGAETSKRSAGSIRPAANIR